MKRVAAPDWAISPEKAETGLAYLQCTKDGVPVEKIPLDTQSFYVFGRSDSVDILLQHESISRQHAIIGHHKTGSLVIVDLKSGNGTFVGNTRLPPNYPTVLKEGAAITFGASTRTYVVCGTNEKKQRILRQQQILEEKKREEEILKDPEDMDAAMALLYTDLNSSLSNPNLESEPVAISKKKSDRRVSFSDKIVEVKVEKYIGAEEEEEENKEEKEKEIEKQKKIAEEKEGDFLKKAHGLHDAEDENPDEPKPVKKKRKPNPPPPPQNRVRAMQMLKNISKTKTDGLYDDLPITKKSANSENSANSANSPNSTQHNTTTSTNLSESTESTTSTNSTNLGSSTDSTNFTNLAGSTDSTNLGISTDSTNPTDLGSSTDSLSATTTNLGSQPNSTNNDESTRTQATNDAATKNKTTTDKNANEPTTTSKTTNNKTTNDKTTNDKTTNDEITNIFDD